MNRRKSRSVSIKLIMLNSVSHVFPLCTFSDLRKTKDYRYLMKQHIMFRIIRILSHSNMGKREIIGKKRNRDLGRKHKIEMILNHKKRDFNE